MPEKKPSPEPDIFCPLKRPSSYSSRSRSRSGPACELQAALDFSWLDCRHRAGVRPREREIRATTPKQSVPGCCGHSVHSCSTHVPHHLTPPELILKTPGSLASLEIRVSKEAASECRSLVFLQDVFF